MIVDDSKGAPAPAPAPDSAPETGQVDEAAQHLMRMVYTATMAALADFFAAQQQAARAEAEAQRSAAIQKGMLDRKISL